MFSSTHLRHNLIDKLLGLMVTMSVAVREMCCWETRRNLFSCLFFGAFKLAYGGQLGGEESHAVSVYT